MRYLEVIISSILATFGSVTVIALGLSGTLGKMLTNRVLEIDRLHYGGQLEKLRDDLNRKVRHLQAGRAARKVIHSPLGK